MKDKTYNPSEFNIYKQIEKSTDIEFLKTLNERISIDIDNISKDSDVIKSMKAKMRNMTVEEYEHVQINGFLNLQKRINKKIKELHSKTYTTTDLKNYAKYLIDVYKQINDKWEDSGYYLNLNSFCETGQIKSLIRKNDKKSIKIEVLNVLRDKLVNDFNLNSSFEIKTFDEFLTIK